MAGAPRTATSALPGKWPAITLLSLCEVLGMALWFSAAVVVPSLRLETATSETQSALIVSAVSVGFVLGTLSSALLGLADRLDSRRFFAAAALIGAAANLAALWIDPASPWFPAMRLVVGMCCAGIYPVGMRMAASWALHDRGLLVGIIVGAEVVGLAMPHLIDAWGGLDWRLTIAASSVSALISAAAIWFVRLGPILVKPTSFRWAFALRGWREPALRLANIGYLGHMWELFAMWGWIGFYLADSFAARGAGDPALARYVAFASIAAGGLGCLVGGLIADRLGRTACTIAAMAVSGACCLIAGPAFGAAPVIVIVLCLVWGAAVVADSPQFTASVIELSPPELTGTMITA